VRLALAFRAAVLYRRHCSVQFAFSSVELTPPDSVHSYNRIDVPVFVLIPSKEVEVIRIFPAAAVLMAFLLAANAMAAGGTSITPAPAASAAATPNATIVKKKLIAKKIVPVTTPVAATITDDWAKKFGDLGPAYLAAVKLAQSAKYDDAIKAFNALNKPDDPRVLNWIGFSLRKMGNVEAALPYYDKALSKAPDFTPAHEYLGEAYLQMKDATKAKDQLAQIEKLCGNKSCEEYKDLSQSIAKAAL
jgi:tetratricopeptide (TPR) repeat protein